MTTDKDALLQSISEAIAQLKALISPLPAEDINKAPYEGSWTAAQLVQHVSKSIAAMGNAMGMQGKPANRDTAERVPELKKIFLDFSHKMSSPDFIIPGAGPFEKGAVVKELDSAFDQLKKGAQQADLDELTDKLPLGPITKLEIIYFTLYHTQRHLHQLQNICAALQHSK